MKLASSPSMNSSITTRGPRSSYCTPSVLPGEHGVDGGVGFVRGHRHHHALAGSQAVGLDDDRRTFGVHQAWAAAESANVWYPGRRDLVADQELLAKSLELSSWAASLVGPKISSPAARKASTTPAASGPRGRRR